MTWSRHETPNSESTTSYQGQSAEIKKIVREEIVALLQDEEFLKSFKEKLKAEIKAEILSELKGESTNDQ
jgi:hypothetical protein